MSEAADTIVHVMQSNPAPVGGWTMPDLRRLTGLSVGSFAAAVLLLRREGKMHLYELSLSRSAWPVASAPEPVASIAEQVAEEARVSSERKARARVYGQHYEAAPSAGAQLQEKALNDAPVLAAGIIRDRWKPVWDRVCRHALATNQKPVAAMIALLDRGLAAEVQA